MEFLSRKPVPEFTARQQIGSVAEACQRDVAATRN
jgi:hypothetical protein